MPKARCMKCKVDREMKNPKELMTAKGGVRVAGVCPVCGTKMTTFIAVHKASKEMQDKVAAYKKKHGGSRKSKSRKSKSSRKSGGRKM